MQTLSPAPAADARARYNRNWSIRLVLLNTGLLLWLTIGNYLDAYVDKYSTWLLLIAPLGLTLMAGVAIASLPRAWQPVFWALAVLGVVLTVLGMLVGWWMHNFLRGKW